jgi:hypothetical protein
MDWLKKTEDHLHTWLANYRKASEIAPAVQESLEEVAWARQALSTRPPEAANVSSTQVDQWAHGAFGRITELLPQMPSYGPAVGTQVNSVTSSANTAVMAYILDVRQVGTPTVLTYADNQTKAYRAIQEKHDRPARVRRLLAQRWPTMLGRFDAAVTAYGQCGAGTGSEAAAAVEMRTVLDGAQGELFAEARSSQGEKMTWSMMANRLGRDPAHQQQLLNQEALRDTLYDYLSAVAKRRPIQHPPSFDSLWSLSLDHLFAILA